MDHNFDRFGQNQSKASENRTLYDQQKGWDWSFLHTWIAKEQKTNKRHQDVLKPLIHSLIRADVPVSLIKPLQTEFEKQPLKNVSKPKAEQWVRQQLCLLFASPSTATTNDNKSDKKLAGLDLPELIVFTGLQGAGKTTSICKWASYLQKKQKRNVLVIGADTFRAGASDQLKQNALKCRIPFYIDPLHKKTCCQIIHEGIQSITKSKSTTTIFVDTAGRHKQDLDLQDEWRQIVDCCWSYSTQCTVKFVYVLDGSTGQAALPHIQYANDQLKKQINNKGLDSLVLTKMDPSVIKKGRGGGTLSVVKTLGLHVSFLGTGEKLDAWEPFVVESFVNRLMGVPDWSGIRRLLVEDEDDDDKDEKKEEERMMAQLLAKQKPKYVALSLGDTYGQLQSILKIAPMEQLQQMMAMDTVCEGTKNEDDNDEKQASNVSDLCKKLDVLCCSLTADELQLCQPKILHDRASRICRGSGLSLAQVTHLLNFWVRLCTLMQKHLQTQIKGNPHGKERRRLEQWEKQHFA